MPETCARWVRGHVSDLCEAHRRQQVEVNEKVNEKLRYYTEQGPHRGSVDQLINDRLAMRLSPNPKKKHVHHAPCFSQRSRTASPAFTPLPAKSQWENMVHKRFPSLFWVSTFNRIPYSNENRS